MLKFDKGRAVITLLSLIVVMLLVGCSDRPYNDVTGPTANNPNTNQNPNPNTNPIPNINVPTSNDINHFVYRRNGYWHWNYEKFAVNFRTTRVKYSFISSNGGGYAKITFLDYNHNYLADRGYDFSGNNIYEEYISTGRLVRYIEVTMSDYEGSLVISAESY